MKIIVCGSRSHVLSPKGIEMLDKLNAEYGFTLLIHGACRGIDLSCAKWGHSRHIALKPFPAKWYDENGKLDYSAGPRRNLEMAKWLSKNGGGLCIAFNGNRGTANCKECALSMNIPVLDLTNPDYVIKVEK